MRAPRSPRRATIATLTALAAVLVGGSACTGESPSVDAAADADTTVAAATIERADSAAVPSEFQAGGATVPGGRGTTGLENFAIPVDPRLAAVPETVAVEIENVSSVAVAVHARAGARPVLLDTLRAGVRFRVDLVGPPGAIELLWTAIGTLRSGTVPVPIARDTVLYLAVGVPVAP